MTNEVNVSLLSRLVASSQAGMRSNSGSSAQGQGTEGAGAGQRAEGMAAQKVRAGPEAAPPREQQESSNLTEEELNAAVGELNDIAQTIRRELKFSMDQDSGRPIIEVYDANTEELIRQIPPEQVLDVIRHLKEFDSGLLKEQA